MNTLKEDLLKVRAKIEKGWCQGSLARDADQHPVDVRAPEAVTFCVVGAVDSTIVLNCVVLNALWKTLNAEKYVGGLAQFNDAPGRTSEAARFCIIGAVYAVSKSPAYSVELLHKVLLARDDEHLTLPNYNDAKGRTKRQILALIDDAIKLAEGT